RAWGAEERRGRGRLEKPPLERAAAPRAEPERMRIVVRVQLEVGHVPTITQSARRTQRAQRGAADQGRPSLRSRCALRSLWIRLGFLPAHVFEDLERQVERRADVVRQVAIDGRLHEQ